MGDILRLIAGGLLALCCCYGGILIKRHYSERQKFYRTAADFANYLGNEISFKKTPLPTVIQQFSNGGKGGFIKMLNDFLVCKKKNASFDTLLKEVDAPHMKAAEKKKVLEFLNSLGKNSIDDELAQVRRSEAEYQAKEKTCAEETKKLGGMYFKLAVLLGIACIVVLA